MPKYFKCINSILQIVIKELDILLHAFMLYSRIPVDVEYREDFSQKSLRYFPLVGLFLSSISSLFLVVLNGVFPLSVNVVLSVIVMMIFTGAMHEDGLADSVDAFFGGFSKDKVLAIMKDSRIGTYGTLSLICSFAIRVFALCCLPFYLIPVIFMLAHLSSRVAPVILANTSCYVNTQGSKSSYLSGCRDYVSIAVAVSVGFIPVFMFQYMIALYYAMVYLLIIFIVGIYSYRRIGGFTGDVLGALQQLCEISFYIVCLYVFRQ